VRVTWMRVGLLIACVLSAARSSAQETPVFVDVAVRQVVQQTAMVSARVVTATPVIVSSRVAESIASVNVQLGDRVAANRILVSLSTDDLQRDLRTLEGRMAYLSDRLSLLKEQEALRVGQLSRAEQLSERDLMTTDARDQSRLNLIQIRRDRLETEFQLNDLAIQIEALQADIRHSELRAPAAGRVLSVKVSQGQYVRVGDPLVEILPDRGVELEAEVRPDAYAALELGQEIQGQVGNQTVTFTVRARLAEENARTGSRYIRLAPKTSLREAIIGQSVQIAVPLGPRADQVTISKDAVMPVADGHRVVIVKEGKAQIRRITLGPGVGDRIVVLDGVAEDDTVVVQGQEGLRPNQSVKITKG
jgi:RND family efflux transporter MFP subunit